MFESDIFVDRRTVTTTKRARASCYAQEERAKPPAKPVLESTVLCTLIAMPITGVLCKIENIGWPASFYLFGSLGILWSILMAIFGQESPSTHKWITREELRYIQHESNVEKDGKKLSTPWKSILTSLPVWAIAVCQIGETWGHMTLVMEIPSYMQKILNFDIASNSLVSALPYLAAWLFSFVAGSAADILTARKWTSTTTNRKIFCSIASFVPAVTLFGITFVDTSDRLLSIFLFVLSVGATTSIFSGYYVNHIDLSPNHAATLTSLTSMVSNIFSLLAPLYIDLVNYISGYQETDKPLWDIVFYTSSLVYAVTGMFYVCAASAEVQPWNDLSEREKNDGSVKKEDPVNF
ncbi:hypothetical protein NQ318_004205 [Aromia moschata]|uniref:Inorganic phosphate cotransporter n=1 Tax=Aromia moschata TaxID=1265417 RepID=A0AAV8Y5F9_9CUCU|nr:hypothetical protein NQ318_004205 [Aromia moschata]